jgi:hypothetical protein
MWSLSRMAVDILILGATALLFWAPVGRVLLGKIGIDRSEQGISLPVAIGMGFWGYCVLLMGCLGLIYGWALASGAGLLILVLGAHRNIFPAVDAPAAPGTGSRADRVFVRIAIAISLAYIAIGLGSALSPELSFDALNVHLPYARDSASAHRAVFAPNNWSSVMPALPLMAYITAFAWSGVTLAKLFNLLCYVVTGGTVWWFSMRRWGRVHAAAATLLFLSSPLAIYEATTALIDLPFALFSAMGIFSLLEWTVGDKEPFLRLSAFSLGLAFGCKYHAAFWFLPIFLVLTWHCLKVKKTGVAQAFSLMARYALIAAAPAVPWLVRAWYFSGNPVFPLANSLFRSPYFPPAMEAAAKAMYANEGVGRSFQALALLPWTVTFHPGPFRGTPGMLLLPGAVLAVIRIRTRQARYAFLLAALYFYTWAMTAQEIRYLLPLIPLLSILAAAGILGTGATLEKQAGARGGLRQFAGAAILLLGSLTALPPVYPLWVRDWTYWHGYRSPLRFLAGKETFQEFLNRDVPSIYVYDYINANLRPSDRVLLLNDSAQFYSRIATLYSFTVEGERILQQTSEEGVLRQLKESGISYVLLNYNGVEPLSGVEPRQGVYFFLNRAFQDRHLESVFSRNNVVLYRVGSR